VKKRILLQLDTDKHPSAFDAIAAYDAGAEVVYGYGGVRPEEVRDLVYGAIFTRGPKDLHNTAIWIGGSDLPIAERIFEVARASFLGPLRVSVMLDARGANTTAAAAVRKVASAVPVRGEWVAVIGGAGRVGSRVSALLASEGAHLVLVHFTAAQDRARELGRTLEERFGVRVESVFPQDPAALRATLDRAVALVSAGPPGVRTVPRDVWAAIPTLRVLADLNAVPPSGVEGVEVRDDGTQRDGRLCFGAIGIGNFKMRVQYACVAQLFERNDLVMELERVYEVARGLLPDTAP
jgi:hypothetical protein